MGSGFTIQSKPFLLDDRDSTAVGRAKNRAVGSNGVLLTERAHVDQRIPPVKRLCRMAKFPGEILKPREENLVQESKLEWKPRKCSTCQTKATPRWIF
mmetsp:Transcript_954/g.3018  ORF Transcript_954/g.3018 Transcript_954/m.3018 type:complete len:98 (+) Transcript_954:556-849(+)